MMRCMRTTLTLEPDAFQAAKAKAAHENISLGRAVSALILQAIHAEPGPRGGEGRRTSAVLRSAGGTYTAETVEEMLDDE